MSKVFISYRRDDSSGYAHAIHARLVQQFSQNQVFMDVDTLEPGVDFVHAIEKAVGECDVLVALIGKRWLGMEPGDTSRLDNTKDYVRLEVSSALARDIRVIPVLVDGMTMPKEDSLPSPLQAITRRNAIEISNTRFNYDVDQLVTAVGKILDALEAKRKADEEQERNRAQQEAERHRLEVEAQRQAEQERLREQERRRSEEEAKRKAEEENRKRIEEEKSRAQQEIERRHIEAEAQHKLEEERLREQELQRSKEEAREKAEEEERLREQERQRYAEDVKWKAEQENQIRIEEAATRARLQEQVTQQTRPDRPEYDRRLLYVGGGVISAILIAVIAALIMREKKEEPAPPPPPPPIVYEQKATAPVGRSDLLTERKAPDSAKNPEEKPARLSTKVFRDGLKNGGEGPEMAVILRGSFKMGDVQGGGLNDEVPVHIVTIQKSFAIGRYEVTFDEYDRFARATNRKLPGDHGWGRGRRPVINVSWDDANAYAKWLSEQTGKRYRLPTEAEWEYAARAGKETNYWWGNNLITGMANCDGCGSQWDNKQTAPVGSFKPNAFGLYDTAGNVREWVEDCYDDNYNGAPVDGSAKEGDSRNCDRRVIRGGSWYDVPRYLRSSDRGSTNADDGSHTLGFRLVQDTN